MPGGWPRHGPEQGSLQPVARRAPPARACRPPPLLMDSGTCSTDTRCSAPAGLVPGCQPSARPPVWRDFPRYVLQSPRSRLPDTDNEEQPPQLESVRLQPVPPLSPTQAHPSAPVTQFPLHLGWPGTPNCPGSLQHPENPPRRSARDNLRRRPQEEVCGAELRKATPVPRRDCGVS